MSSTSNRRSPVSATKIHIKYDCSCRTELGHARVSLMNNAVHRIINPSREDTATFYNLPPGCTECIVTLDGGVVKRELVEILSHNHSIEMVVPLVNRKVVAFFIGGAGDKESYYFSGPHGNIDDARATFDKRIKNTGKSTYYTSYYLDYSDACGKSDIKKYIKNNIERKEIPIYIVGHSLGAWNGAHLSKILADEGYTVKMLITLDPVGAGFLVWVGSDIYGKEPEPSADMWINVLADPKVPDKSDSVANFGERWTIKRGPDINATMDTHHASAREMFHNPIQDHLSAADHMFDSIDMYINR